MSKTIVQIRIVKGIPDDQVETVKGELQAVTPSAGESAAHPITVMPDQVWKDSEDACADALGWTATVANPDFDASQPASDENPETITNPITKAWNVTLVFRQRVTLLLKNYLKKKNVDPVVSAVTSGVDQADASISVVDGDS